MKLKTILQKLYRHITLLIVVAVVMVAAYVSIGREFMPAVSGYTSFFEGQIYESTGLPVQIDSISGSFDGFNPVLQLNNLRLLLGGDSDQANDSVLEMGSALIVVDMPRSLWERRWVLQEFTIDGLAFNLLQDEQGVWQVAGLDGGGGSNIDLETLYQTFLRVSRLDLGSVVINARNQAGERFSIDNGTAVIQNRDSEHYLHVDANLQQLDEPLRLSLEFSGDSLANVSGQVHLDIPQADYSTLVSGITLADLDLTTFLGGGEFWLGLGSGQIQSITSDIAVEQIDLATPGEELLQVSNVSGFSVLERTAASGQWQGRIVNFSVEHEERKWNDFNVAFDLLSDDYLEVTADHLYLDLLADLAMNSNLLSPDQREQLAAYAPTGALRNLTVTLPLTEDSSRALTVIGNADSIALGSVRGSPNMWGITGYIELSETTADYISGFAEVESHYFSINIPNVFTQVWDYDYVNGRLDFRVDLRDGQDVMLASNVVIAESEAVDGRVQFTSNLRRFLDGGRDAHLELLVGAARMDATQKTLYLPDGANVQPDLRSTMEFLERAIIDGDLENSAVLFRGATVNGSGPAEKTFQSFFQLESGEFAFSDEWPALSDLSAVVKTSDNDIAITVSQGGSLDLRLGEASGIVSRDENQLNWLRVSGDAQGTTAAGLEYLQAAPVGENLRSAFSDWQTAGDFNADIDVLIPLGQPDSAPDIRLVMNLENNTLDIPEFSLAFADVNGPIIFDTRTGVEETLLTANLFNKPVSFTLGSLTDDSGRITAISLRGDGSVATQDLAAWPRQSAFVRALLNRADGEFAYTTDLLIDQTGESPQQTQLAIQSDLLGTALLWPEPFSKPAESSSALALQMDFADGTQLVRGELGDNLQFQLSMADSRLVNGVVQVGTEQALMSSLADSESEGLAILGAVERLELSQWTDFITGIGADTATPASGVESLVSGASDSIAFIDVTTDVLDIYEQEIASVALRIEPNEQQQGWLTRLISENLQGRVILPFDSGNPLQLNFEYVRLPGPEESEEDIVAGNSQDVTIADVAEQAEEERVDPLLEIDPRQLPAMQFATDEFMIGDLDFGSWAFNLMPTEEGASFSDLSFDFRGLRVGMGDEIAVIEQLTPQFNWFYDGNEHRSELTATLTADDIGDVLLANGFAASLTSSRADFVADVQWPGSPAFFAGSSLSGDISLRVENGRFLQDSAGSGALKLVSIINFSAIMRRLRFSDDLLRRGLAFDEITGNMEMEDGLLHLRDRLVISGPSSLYQITGDVNLAEETIQGEMFVTLPVSDNIPWLGLLTANIPLAVGAYLFDQIFGEQVDSLTSAVYTLEGPWDGLQPEFKQAFGSPENDAPVDAPPAAEQPVAPQ